ncbi:hypothetical protein BOTNAR_0252g00150 [Botryotinia narcissicola]|uniref:Uncharacterized protein n=1 Tax=Botryotinia narcissicola TaxID=278944 RepID=A0A4Z1I1B8_9HELO|nr:hypothetical protein BOTNAR_0252g00150 [Botryotinia narcissicola]
MSSRTIQKEAMFIVDNCVQTDVCGHHLDEVSNIGNAPPILPQEPQYQTVQIMPFGLILGDALYYE